MQRPLWLNDFSARFGLYGAKPASTVMGMKRLTAAEMRAKAADVVRDLAEQEENRHRSSFDLTARLRAEALRQAADIVLALPEEVRDDHAG